MENEKLLIELLEQSLNYDGTGREMRFTGGDVTPCIIANGVTIATDNNVGDKLSPAAYKLSETDRIPVTVKLPERCKYVLGYRFSGCEVEAILIPIQDQNKGE